MRGLPILGAGLILSPGCFLYCIPYRPGRHKPGSTVGMAGEGGGETRPGIVL
jgi:hypothetical protein